MDMVGKTLLHYRVIEKVGQGSTGDVYLAEDTLRERQVALKVLPELIRRDSDRLWKVRTEAEAAIELNHPNIVKIYSYEEAEVEGVEGPVPFVTMEYVQGKQLSVLLSYKGLTLDQFFNCFIPLSDALCYAHELGVTHRDLNPNNVIITREGVPKLLDFGMASITRPETRITDSTASSKIADVLKNMTRDGNVVGAPAYMSPEQVEGEATDYRTDIFSFGVMLYEAITGRRPFQGKNHLALVTNIVKVDPTPVTTLKPDVPYLLGRMITNSVRKDKRRRYQSMMEVRRELEDVRLDVVGGRLLMEMPDTMRVRTEKPVVLSQWQEPRMMAAAAAGIFILGLITAWLITALSGDSIEPRPRKFQLPLDITTISAVDNAQRDESFDPLISPDGNKIIYTYRGLLWLRDLSQLKPRALPGTDGGRMAFWAPGSDSIGYFYVDDALEESMLRKVPINGTFSIDVCRLPEDMMPRGGTWHQEGGIVVSMGGGTNLDGALYCIAASGDTLDVFLEPDAARGEIGLIHPQFLPDGETLLFTVTRRDRTGIIVAQEGDTRTNIMAESGVILAYPTYSTTGHLIYQKGMTASHELWAVPFDASDAEITGLPFMIAEHGANPSTSKDGALLYHSAATEQNDQLVWVDREGRITASIGRSMERIDHPVLSPDEKQIAVTGREQGNFDIWIYSQGQASKRLTADPAYDFLPVWSPSGDRIAYNSVRGVSADIFVQNVDGSGAAINVVSSPRSDWISTWSLDGKYLTFDAEGPGTRRDLWYVEMGGQTQPKPFLQTRYQEFYPVLSPDSEYVLYQSNESGRFEIYVRAFPNSSERFIVSVDDGIAGVAPRWNQNGSELYFVEENILMAVKVNTIPNLQLGWPEELFDAEEAGVRLLGEYQEAAYDVTKDGLRFVAVQERRESTMITLVENWFEEYRK